MKTIIALAFTLVISLQAAGQNLDDIISKHIEAVGGKDNWAKLKTMKVEGLLKTQGLEIPITMIQVDKTAMRQNITVMGMTGYTIITPTEGWRFMPFQGQTKPEPITADELKISQDQLYLQDAFITYAELGKKIEYLGTEEMEGSECHKIKLTDKNEVESTYFIDSDNYLVIKQITKAKVNGQEFENAQVISNYKKLEEGIMFPMSISGNFGGIEFQKIEINIPVDEAEFKVAN